jgi:hypothetical protein
LRELKPRQTEIIAEHFRSLLREPRERDNAEFELEMAQAELELIHMRLESMHRSLDFWEDQLVELRLCQAELCATTAAIQNFSRFPGRAGLP